MTFERFVIILNLALVGWSLNTGYAMGKPNIHFREGHLVTYLSAFNLLAIGFFCWTIYDRSAKVRGAPWRSSSFIWALMACGFLFLAFDESLSFHEEADHFLHRYFHFQETPLTDRIDDFILLLYAIGGCVFLYQYRNGLRSYREQWKPLAGGFVLTLVMIMLDALTNRHDIITDRGLHMALTLLEDTSKIGAELLFLLAVTRCFAWGQAGSITSTYTPPVPPGRENRRATTLILFGLIVAGFVTLVLHSHLPLVRNGIIYAHIVSAFDLYGWRGVAEHALNKPVGFAILSWPLVKLAGLSAGLTLSSALWTALWILSVPLLVRRLLREGDHAGGLTPLVVGLTLFNPLVIYQFTSAYPDTLFALLFTWALYFLDRTFGRDAKWFDPPLLCGFILASIWVKHHGFILIPLTLLFASFRWSVVAQSYRSGSRVAIIGAISFVATLLFLVLAQKGLAPTFNLAHNGGNYAGGSDRLRILVNNGGTFVIWALVTFGPLAAFFVVRREGGKRWDEWRVALLLFLLFTLFYAGVRENIRYFLPITPLLAITPALALWRLPKRGRQAALALFVAVNGFAILYYDNSAVYSSLHRSVSLPAIENLRLNDEQRREARALSLIRKRAPEYGNQLIFMSHYYRGAVIDTWRDLGYFSPDLKICYATHWRSDLPQRCGFDTALFYEYVGFGHHRSRMRSEPPIGYAARRHASRLYSLRKRKAPSAP